MMSWIITLGIVVSLLLGGIAGYNIGTYNMRREALANNAAHWKAINYIDGQYMFRDNQFAWGPLEQGRTIVLDQE